VRGVEPRCDFFLAAHQFLGSAHQQAIGLRCGGFRREKGEPDLLDMRDEVIAVGFGPRQGGGERTDRDVEPLALSPDLSHGFTGIVGSLRRTAVPGFAHLVANGRAAGGPQQGDEVLLKRLGVWRVGIVPASRFAENGGTTAGAAMPRCELRRQSYGCRRIGGACVLVEKRVQKIKHGTVNNAAHRQVRLERPIKWRDEGGRIGIIAQAREQREQATQRRRLCRVALAGGQPRGVHLLCGSS